MSIYEELANALMIEDFALAPFMDYSKETEEKMQKMGVINEKSELNSGTVKAIACVFASNFNDCFNDYYPNEFEILDIAFDAVKNLFIECELSGAYIYMLICCGLVECPVPNELRWLARREDVLYAYLQNFIEAMAQYEIVLEEGKG